MSDDFDPYFKWLAIPPEEQPPNHYRLLGVPLFLDDPDVIEAAADQRMMLLRSYQGGTRAALSQKLLNEVSNAKVCLLNADRKTEYDAQVRAEAGHEFPLVEAITDDFSSAHQTESQVRKPRSSFSIVSERYAWLGIPPEDWPPTDHQLLGLHPDVRSRDAVEAAVRARWKTLAPYLESSDSRIASTAESLIEEIKIAALSVRDEGDDELYGAATDTPVAPTAGPAVPTRTKRKTAVAAPGPVIQTDVSSPTARLKSRRGGAKSLPAWAKPVIGGIGAIVLVVIVGSIIFSSNDGRDKRNLNDGRVAGFENDESSSPIPVAAGPEPIESADTIVGGNGEVRQTLLFMTGHHVVIPRLFLKEQTPFTIEGFVIPMAFSGHSTVFGNAQNSGCYLGLHDEAWAFAVRERNGYKIVRSELPIVLNERVHVAGVYDGESTQLYVDGKRQQSTLNAGPTIVHSPFSFMIAADPDEKGQAEHFFMGSIDTVRFSRTARYNKDFKVTQDLAADTDTIALYRLDQGNGEVAIDESSNKYRGEIVGARWIAPPNYPKLIMEKQSFNITSNAPQVEIDLAIPELLSPIAILEIGISHMWDDEADGGMSYKLLDEDGTVLAEEFDTKRGVRWATIRVQSPSTCKLLLQDFDTKSNGVSVEAWIRL